ncbi:MAG: aminoglycoside phosphotransferase family protein [Acidimicrobiales bacterium]
MGDLVIPAKLATKSVAWEGEAARDWLARLPALVAEVAEAWDLEVGPPLEPGGNISWVAPARRRADGLDAILKVQLPHPESAPEAVALRVWAGEGAVLLLDHDPERWALLIERCRPGYGIDSQRGARDAVRAGAAIGARLHAVPPPDGLPTLTDVLASWADSLDELLERRPPDDAGLVRRALVTMRTRPASTEHQVLLHGDLNPTNLLAAEREPWLAIDPKPMLGDPAYDGPRLVTQPDPCETDNPAATIGERLEIVSDAMGVDREALVEWCLVGAVEMGAWARAHGDTRAADRCETHVTLLAPHLS